MAKAITPTEYPSLGDDEFWGDFPHAETRDLVRDFSDGELLKLYVLHFHDQDDRSKEELLQVGGEMQDSLLMFARDCGLDHPFDRLYVAEVMFTIIGPHVPNGE